MPSISSRYVVICILHVFWFFCCCCWFTPLLYDSNAFMRKCDSDKSNTRILHTQTDKSYRTTKYFQLCRVFHYFIALVDVVAIFLLLFSCCVFSQIPFMRCKQSCMRVYVGCHHFKKQSMHFALVNNGNNSVVVQQQLLQIGRIEIKKDERKRTEQTLDVSGFCLCYDSLLRFNRSQSIINKTNNRKYPNEMHTHTTSR